VAYQFFLIGFVILTGFMGHLFFKKTRIPEALFLVTFGLLIGPISGYFYNEPLVPVEPFENIIGLVTTIALIIILLDSGFDFDIFDIAKTFSKATFFTVTTFILTTGLVSVFMIYVVGWPVLMAFLIGAVSSGTTTVTVSHLIEHLKMKPDVKQLLVLESIINDVTIITGGVIITRFIKAEELAGASMTIQEIASTLFGSILIAIAGGAVFFAIWFKTLNMTKTSPLKFAYTLGMLFVMYDAIEYLRGSGPIAVLIFTLLVGNSYKLFKRFGLQDDVLEQSKSAIKSIKQVLGDVSFFVKAFFFVFLGILFDPRLISVDILIILSGILISIIVGRYISSKILALRYSEFSPYSKIIAVMLPRGFTATVVAFLPGEEGVTVPGFTEIILLMVFVTTVIAIIGAGIYAKTTS
jgi:NhaP-type Na+/H+ or K+/H+ antiporter